MKILHPVYTKRLIKLSIPVMLTQLGQISVNIFDNVIVGKLLGKDALASVSLGNSVFFSFFILALGMSFAMPPLVSRAHAKNDDDEINSVFRHGFILNVGIGILMVVLLYSLIPFLHLLGQPAKIMPNTKSFLQIMTISIIPFMVFQTLRELSEGLSFTFGVTIATIFANIINIALNYVFIKGLLGIPPMGVNGSATATLIARIFMMIFLYIVLKNSSRTKKYIQEFTLRFHTLRKEMFLKLFKLGVPTAFQMFFELTAFAVSAFICGLVSTVDIASHQIAMSMVSMTFNLCMGFGVASTIMIGNLMGEKKYKEIRVVGKNNFKIGFSFMLFWGILFILFRTLIPHFFVDGKEAMDVIKLASNLLIVAALFQLSDGIQVIIVGCLRGIQDVNIPSIITFIAYWVITIPLGYFLCAHLKMGAMGMWISLGLGLTISAILLTFRFRNLSKKH